MGEKQQSSEPGSRATGQVALASNGGSPIRFREARPPRSSLRAARRAVVRTRVAQHSQASRAEPARARRPLIARDARTRPSARGDATFISSSVVARGARLLPIRPRSRGERRSLRTPPPPPPLSRRTVPLARDGRRRGGRLLQRADDEHQRQRRGGRAAAPEGPAVRARAQGRVLRPSAEECEFVVVSR
eukprot:31564-Pelagococcus_subviridis.AAC.5